VTFIQFLDAQGIAWTYVHETGQLVPVNGTWPLFETADCSGTPYVPRFPARVSFSVLAYGPRVIPDNATVLTKTILTARANAQCSTVVTQTMPVVALASAVTVTVPTQFPGVLPIRPEFQP
jgi:hypothetical protein